MILFAEPSPNDPAVLEPANAALVTPAGELVALACRVRIDAVIPEPPMLTGPSDHLSAVIEPMTFRITAVWRWRPDPRLAVAGDALQPFELHSTNGQMTARVNDVRIDRDGLIGHGGMQVVAL